MSCLLNILLHDSIHCECLVLLRYLGIVTVCSIQHEASTVHTCRFYHADPHAGNILRMNDGRLCYLDFGMMGRIDRSTRQVGCSSLFHTFWHRFRAKMGLANHSLARSPTGERSRFVNYMFVGVD